MNAVETQSKPAGAGIGGSGRGGTRNAAGEQPPRLPWRSLLAALLRALPWALGAALGVAAGAFLTAVSGAGAPGAGGIQPSIDLVALPAIAFAAVLLAHLLAQALAGAVRRLRTR